MRDADLSNLMRRLDVERFVIKGELAAIDLIQTGHQVLKKVVLLAPLGPIRPKIELRRIDIDTLSSAVTPPIVFVQRLQR